MHTIHVTIQVTSDLPRFLFLRPDFPARAFIRAHCVLMANGRKIENINATVFNAKPHRDHTTGYGRLDGLYNSDQVEKRAPDGWPAQLAQPLAFVHHDSCAWQQNGENSCGCLAAKLALAFGCLEWATRTAGFGPTARWARPRITVAEAGPSPAPVGAAGQT